MRYLGRPSTSKRLARRLLPCCAALALGCQGNIVPPAGSDTSGSGGTGNGPTGSGGSSAQMATPCAGASDPRMVVADQRIMLVTKPQLVNTIAYLIDQTEADAIVSSGMFNITADSDRHFPPADGEDQNLNTGNISSLFNLGQHVQNYVEQNFSTVTKCQTATDACATSYLTALAARAYRRQLTADEQTRFTSLYQTLKSQMVSGYQVTTTVQKATGYAVWALLMSPQLDWRWEIGGSQMSSSPPGVYLTDYELASQLSFFMTDAPPDDMLLASAKAGMLRMNMASHVSRLLQTTQARAWLRHVMELYFLINQLPTAPVDPNKFPVFDSGLANSMMTESEMFLDNVLWGSNSKLKDLLLSRTTFVNTRLAQQVYNVPVPSGAALDTFVQTDLPTDQRAGILTNAGFLTARSRSDGQDLISRGKTIKAAFLCLITAPPTDPGVQAAVMAAATTLDQQTGQQQAAGRAAIAVCRQCHATFDQYGLALEYYDAVGAYRTTYNYLPGMPAIDGTATLPPELGGATIHNAVELAQNLADSPTFINCISKSMLQYAMTELNAYVELPLAPSQPGCAAADVVQKYQNGPSQTFAGLVTAVTQSPAFVLRKVTP